MNETNMSISSEAPAITSILQTSGINDIIDLTEADESEGTSNSSVRVSNNYVPPQQTGRLSRNRRRTNSSKIKPELADDSICILYEKLLPPPEVQVVNEVTVDGGDESYSAAIDFLSMRAPPIMPPPCGGLDFVSDFQEITNICPDISSEGMSNSHQPINYSLVNHTPAPPQPPALPSCKYASVITERPSQRPFMSHTGLLRVPHPSREVPLNLTIVPSNPPSQDSELGKLDKTIKTPKIQCGICLDGPDEIATTDRNFTSTNCGHVFCNTCIKTSMRNQAKCPKCRKKITARSIHPLYL